MQRRCGLILNLVPKRLHIFYSRFLTKEQTDQQQRTQLECTFHLYESAGSFMNQSADFVLASVLAVACSASLIVPMVIMALDPFLVKSLRTTSVSVIIFGFILAIWDTKTVMILTPADSVVLVVFVGLGGSP